MDDRFANPFAKVRRLHPDNPGDRELILRYVRHHEPDPLDAEHLALGVCESIRDGELTLTIEDELKQKEFSDPIGELYGAQDGFQTKVAALIESYEAHVESLKTTAA